MLSMRQLDKAIDSLKKTKRFVVKQTALQLAPSLLYLTWTTIGKSWIHHKSHNHKGIIPDSLLLGAEHAYKKNKD